MKLTECNHYVELNLWSVGFHGHLEWPTQQTDLRIKKGRNIMLKSRKLLEINFDGTVTLQPFNNFDLPVLCVGIRSQLPVNQNPTK